MDRSESYNRYALIENLLEPLPPMPATIGVRRELFTQANIALARRDTRHLDKLYREVQALARSLGIEGGGRINRQTATHQPESNPTAASASAVEAHSTNAAGPGLPGWGWRAKPASGRAPTREHAPIRYPWGGEPPVPEPPQPPARLPATLEARIIAYDAEREPRRRRSPAYWHGFAVPRTLAQRLFDLRKPQEAGKRSRDTQVDANGSPPATHSPAPEPPSQTDE